jgi:hypothetical protein
MVYFILFVEKATGRAGWETPGNAVNRRNSPARPGGHFVRRNLPDRL